MKACASWTLSHTRTAWPWCLRLLKHRICIAFLALLCILAVYLTTSADVTIYLDQSFGPNRNEKRHVVFIKVHKAASTTLMKVMARFGLRRRLVFALPRNRMSNVISEYWSFEVSQVRPAPTGQYDMLCCHVIYNRSSMAPVFPPDTQYVTILREPFAQFLSAFRYYRDVYPRPYLRKLRGTSALDRYFKKRHEVEPRDPLESFTNSRMALDLGLSPRQLHNSSAISEFVARLDREMDLVLLAEHFDESLVLLRRRLGWGLRDVLQTSSNAHHRGEPLTPSPGHRRRHRQVAKPDYALYDHFYAKFWTAVLKEGADFFQEVQALREVRASVEEFCRLPRRAEDRLKVEASPWSETFFIDAFDCTVITMDEIPLVRLLQAKFPGGSSPAPGMQQPASTQLALTPGGDAQ